MIRKTLTIISLLGLLLSVGLWGVSYWGFLWRSQDLTICLGVYEGAAQFSRLRFEGVDMEAGWQFWGTLSSRTEWLPRAEQRNTHTLMILPFWVIMLMCSFVLAYAIPPLYRRRKRKKLGLCLKCGYDLRASKDRCPECGQEFETA